jgi:Ca2+-binding RTX toxin-like protein
MTVNALVREVFYWNSLQFSNNIQIRLNYNYQLSTEYGYVSAYGEANTILDPPLSVWIDGRIVFPIAATWGAVRLPNDAIRLKFRAEDQPSPNSVFAIQFPDNFFLNTPGFVVSSDPNLDTSLIFASDPWPFSIEVTDASKPEGSSGITTFAFTVTRSGDTSQSATVNWAVTGSGANPASAADFAGNVLPSGTVSFAAGETSKTITIEVAGDSAVEFDEGFTAGLSDPRFGLVISAVTAQGLIQNDDIFPRKTSVVDEIKRLKDSYIGGLFTDDIINVSSSLKYYAMEYYNSFSHLYGNLLTPDRDVSSRAMYFSLRDELVSILESAFDIPGARRSLISTIDFIQGDKLYLFEKSRYFVNLFNIVASGSDIERSFDRSSYNNWAELYTRQLGSGTSAIRAYEEYSALNRQSFWFHINDIVGLDTRNYKNIFNEESNGLNVLLYRTGNNTSPITLGWSVDSVAGDETFSSGLLSFEPEQTNIFINIPHNAFPNYIYNYILKVNHVFDDDAASDPIKILIRGETMITHVISEIFISASDAELLEGTAAREGIPFIITRSGDLSAIVTAEWSVTDSGATPASAADFVGGVLPSGTVSFAAGETSKTITIEVAGDSAVEPDEGFTVGLSAPSAGTEIATASAQGVILNDDAALSISATDAEKPEGNEGSTAYTFTVTRSGNTNQGSTANWAVTGTGTNPASAADFVGGVLPSGTVSFATGETSKTITVQVAGNSSVEPDEGFTVTLSTPSAGTEIATATAPGVILNDDDYGGDNVVVSMPGDETFDLGPGNDMVVFSQTQDKYQIGVLGDVVRVEGPDGLDELRNVELLKFGEFAAITVESLRGQPTTEELYQNLEDGTLKFGLPMRYIGPNALDYILPATDGSDVLQGTSRNDFANLGAGNDAASMGDGDDVVDGGGGNNFLTGGPGRDTFFIDGRDLVPVWSCITDWEPGEALTVWGWREGVSVATWSNSDGLPGYLGATMYADMDGNGLVETAITWTGVALADLPKPVAFEVSGIGVLYFN